MTISALRNLVVGPRVGQVVITGAHRAPMLGPTLLMSGVAGISSWRTSDAHQFPLRRLMEHNDVLVDLDGCVGDSVPTRQVVSLPGETFDHGAVVLPGLLGVLCGHDVTVLTAEMIAACARSLALITPRGALSRPRRADVALLDRPTGHQSLGHAPPYSTTCTDRISRLSRSDRCVPRTEHMSGEHSDNPYRLRPDSSRRASCRHRGLGGRGRGPDLTA